MDECLMQKMWLDKRICFKQKGNEMQHTFNEEVTDKMEFANEGIEDNSTSHR